MVITLDGETSCERGQVKNNRYLFNLYLHATAFNCCILVAVATVIIGVAKGGQGSLKGNTTNDRNATKSQFFLHIQFFSIFRVQQYPHTTVINDNIDQGPGALKSIFVYQFKCTTRVKLKTFVLNVAPSSPHLTFS